MASRKKTKEQETVTSPAPSDSVVVDGQESAPDVAAPDTTPITTDEPELSMNGFLIIRA